MQINIVLTCGLACLTCVLIKCHYKVSSTPGNCLLSDNNISPLSKLVCHNLQLLAEKLAEGLPIQHGVTVTRIDWGDNGVQLQCADGQIIAADAVIVTVSLGVLKVRLPVVEHMLPKVHVHLPIRVAARIDS